MRTLVLLALLSLAGSAFAHGGDPHSAVPVWTADPWIVSPLIASALLYAAGIARLWRKAGPGRGIRVWQAGAYACGWTALAGALVSPLHWLGEHLFTVHMIEHEIVIALAAPLVAVSRPFGAFAWALPRPARSFAGRVRRSAMLRSGWRGLSRPGVATLLQGLAIWLWHVPAFFDAAVVDVAAHRFQHLSFLLTGLLFWWSLLRTASRGAAVWHLFVTMIHTGALGALMVFSPRVLYLAQTLYAPEWGLTPLEDQQLAGVVMWVPAGFVYVGAALAFAALWISRTGARASLEPAWLGGGSRG